MTGKSSTHSGSGSQRQVRDKKKTSHFHRGHLLCKAVRHPSLSNLVIIFIWIDEGHIVINSVKILWIFIIANWGNDDLTEKQHWRHQQLCRIPLSPLDASSRLPRSRDLNVKGQSTSRTWFVIFYILWKQSTHLPNPISNSL